MLKFQWYFKYGKACLQLAEYILHRLPKSDSHYTIWQSVIKLSSCPMIQVEVIFLFEFLDKFIIPTLNASQAGDDELGFSSGYLARLWPAAVLQQNETLIKMLRSPSEHFPLTEKQVKVSLKDSGAAKHFHQEVQRPMLQEALKVVKDHGSEWLTFPKLFGIGADTKYQSSFWRIVLQILGVQLPSAESKQDKKSNMEIHGQNLYTLVSKDKMGLLKWAAIWNLQEPQLLNEIITKVISSPQHCLINRESNPHLFQFYAKYIFSIPVNNVIA